MRRFSLIVLVVAIMEVVVPIILVRRWAALRQSSDTSAANWSSLLLWFYVGLVLAVAVVSFAAVSLQARVGVAASTAALGLSVIVSLWLYGPFYWNPSLVAGHGNLSEVFVGLLVASAVQVALGAAMLATSAIVGRARARAAA